MHADNGRRRMRDGVRAEVVCGLLAWPARQARYNETISTVKLQLPSDSTIMSSSPFYYPYEAISPFSLGSPMLQHAASTAPQNGGTTIAADVHAWHVANDRPTTPMLQHAASTAATAPQNEAPVSNPPPPAGYANEAASVDIFADTLSGRRVTVSHEGQTFPEVIAAGDEVVVVPAEVSLLVWRRCYIRAVMLQPDVWAYGVNFFVLKDVLGFDSVDQAYGFFMEELQSLAADIASRPVSCRR